MREKIEWSRTILSHPRPQTRQEELAMSTLPSIPQNHSGVNKRTVHGVARILEYKIWDSMKRRCENPRDRGYVFYGSRGIKVCAQWQRFENFLEDMGPRPDRTYSIERIDNDGDYCPENCRWATKSEQANNRRNTIRYGYQGQNLTLAEWSLRSNIKYGTLWWRVVQHDWPIERALTTPARIK